jgi:hypothetical protein
MLTLIAKPLERQPTTNPRIELELALPDDLHDGIPAHELAARRGIITPGAEADEDAAVLDVAPDAAVPRAVEKAAEGQVGAAGDDEGRARGLPGLRDQRGRGEGEDDVVGREQQAQAAEGVPERGRRCALPFYKCVNCGSLDRGVFCVPAYTRIFIGLVVAM